MSVVVVVVVTVAVAVAVEMPVVKKIADASKAAVKFVKDHENAIIEGLAIVGGIALVWPARRPPVVSVRSPVWSALRR